MKQIFIILLLAVFTLPAQAQKKAKRQTVYSLVKQKRTIEWYKEQAELWTSHLEKNEKDADGWLNLYTTSRMLKIYRAGVSPGQLDTLVETIGTKIPGTFEYHYISYWNSGFRDLEKNRHHLQKAQELGPDRVELMDDLMAYYQVVRDKKNITNVAHKWYESNDISEGVYAWCYNMLQSVDDNAILITVGDNDTYPAWILQEVHGIKPNVSIMNASLIMVKDYQIKFFKELGIPTRPWDTSMHFHENQAAMVKHIRKHSSRPIYFSITAQKHLYESFEDDIYNVGLAYHWSEHKFDNIAVMKKNYEKYFLLDYLKIELNNDISQGIVDQSSSNYQMCFVTLYHHYKQSEDPRAEEIKELILRIADRTGQTKEILKVL